MEDVYNEMYGQDPEVSAVHAGLECGTIVSKHPGMDAISIGPTLQNVHTPSERMEVASVQKLYDQLLETLKQIPEMAAAAAETPAPTSGAQIANPASENCIAQGGTLTIEERGDDAVSGGGQIGVCTFEDNMQCEEWALMRGECPTGGIKVTGYVTPAARYCAITGGEYEITGNSGQEDEQGACTLPGGKQCDAWDYFNGKCDASTEAQPTAEVVLQPPSPEVCNGMAQALSEAVSRAATPSANILTQRHYEVTQSGEPVPMTDPSAMISGSACRATATGTGEQFASPDAVMSEIDAVLTGGGWEQDMQLASGGPTGVGWGFRSGDLVCMASVIWLPDDSANCPNDKPISECKVTPEQQLYTITLDCAQAVTQAPLQGVALAPAPRSNPASQNCIALGGASKIEERPDGGQFGVCYFGDNYQCEEWALMRGECPAGGVKVTGYNTDAARYCAITGGTYTVTGNSGQDDEQGICTVPDGRQCDAWSYYEGGCEPAEPADQPIGMPNPASQNCVAQGGKLEIEQRGDGGQFGVCTFEDNRQCEEWALMRGECPAGGVKVTGYNTDAARYCAITGGKYTVTGTTPDGMEAGDCTLPSGEVCYVWHYYNGICG